MSSQARTSQPSKLVILISGSGTNLQAFIDATVQQQLNAEISAVISNKANVLGLQRAKDAGIATEVLDHTTFESREAFDQRLAEIIDPYEPDVLILAGFMRILSTGFVSRYKGKLLNIHPSLLPKYPGLHTHRRAVEDGETAAGASVHFVTEELDGGPIIIQAQVPVLKHDDEDSLAARVLVKEHIIYPLTVKWLIEGRVVLGADGVILDGSAAPRQGFQYTDTAG